MPHPTILIRYYDSYPSKFQFKGRNYKKVQLANDLRYYNPSSLARQEVVLAWHNHMHRSPLKGMLGYAQSYKSVETYPERCFRSLHS